MSDAQVECRGCIWGQKSHHQVQLMWVFGPTDWISALAAGGRRFDPVKAQGFLFQKYPEVSIIFRYTNVGFGGTFRGVWIRFWPRRLQRRGAQNVIVWALGPKPEGAPGYHGANKERLDRGGATGSCPDHPHPCHAVRAVFSATFSMTVMTTDRAGHHTPLLVFVS